jgi:hypothetical protein
MVCVTDWILPEQGTATVLVMYDQVTAGHQDMCTRRTAQVMSADLVSKPFKALDAQLTQRQNTAKLALW